MPKIFEYLSYIIRFYSNDHLPIHVRMQKEERETKAEFLFLEEKEYVNEVIEKWNKVFILNQKVDCKKVTTKIKRMKK